MYEGVVQSLRLIVSGVRKTKAGASRQAARVQRIITTCN